MTSFHKGVAYAPSPNFSGRLGHTPKATVVHYTAGGSGGGSVSWLCNPMARASAHFLIERDGRKNQLVDLDQAAWHAGVGEFEGESNPNLFTIGIELANHGFVQLINGDYYYEIGRSLKKYRRAEPRWAELVYDNGNSVSGYWEPYPDAQLDSLQELLLWLKDAGYKEAVSNLVGHEEIALPMGRKKDPGPLFPWERFSRRLDRRTVGMLAPSKTTQEDGGHVEDKRRAGAGEDV